MRSNQQKSNQLSTRASSSSATNSAQQNYIIGANSATDDTDALVTMILHILPLGSRSSSAFTTKHVQVDIGVTSVQQIKQIAHVATSSLVLHGGTILEDQTIIGSVVVDETERKQKRLKQLQQRDEDDESARHQSHNERNNISKNREDATKTTSSSPLDEGKTLPYLVVISCPSRFYESNEWSTNPNTMARLLNAGVVAECALAAASRSMWQRGFPEFFSSAQVLWKMMDSAGKHSSTYQRRIESACLSTTSHRLQPVLPFNEFDGRLMLPPVLMQGLSEKHVDEWVCDTNARDGFSRDEIQAQEDRGKHVRSLRADFEKIEPMVVRVFGYHLPAHHYNDNNHSSNNNNRHNINKSTSRSNNNNNHNMASSMHSVSNSSSISKSFTPREAFLSSNTFGFSQTSASANIMSSNISASGQNQNQNQHQNQHQNQQQQVPATHVIPFTAFFVSRSLLLTTRTAAYSTLTGGTFASSFKFTRRLRALHGMLEDHVDLHQLRVVEGVAEALADRINHLGINVADSSIPPGLSATEWCDLMLLEVVDPGQYANVGEYLLPEMNPLGNILNASRSYSSSSLQTGGENQNNNSSNNKTVFCMSYPSAPDSDWMEQVFGPRGYNTSIGEDTIRKLFWGYDLKTTSVGEAMTHNIDEMERTRSIYHNCSVLPGSRGAPIFKDIKRTVISSHDASKETLYLFAGIERGRSLDEMTTQREDIIALSTSEIARRDSLAYNVRNEAHASNHLALVLLYQTFIAHDVASHHPEHRKYIQEYLSPYEIFTSQGLLSTCHRLMLRDADDFNEYGVDFYEHKDLQNALYCFREGAKMFSTAMIPNLQDYELELRNALQTNVTSVVVALKFSDGTGGVAS